MKLLFDHNLSPRLVRRLADLPGLLARLLTRSGPITGRCLVGTSESGRLHDSDEDSDFSDMSVLRGYPPKVIWIRLGNCTTQQIEDLLRKNHEAVVAFENDEMAGLLSLF